MFDKFELDFQLTETFLRPSEQRQLTIKVAEKLMKDDGKSRMSERRKCATKKYLVVSGESFDNCLVDGKARMVTLRKVIYGGFLYPSSARFLKPVRSIDTKMLKYCQEISIITVRADYMFMFAYEFVEFANFPRLRCLEVGSRMKSGLLYVTKGNTRSYGSGKNCLSASLHDKGTNTYFRVLYKDSFF